jgi:hypothetical protein
VQEGGERGRGGRGENEQKTKGRIKNVSIVRLNDCVGRKSEVSNSENK